jgi:DNA-binding transcriptional LysR family regulator
MAIYHFPAKIISRASGSSALAAAAYRSASRLHDQRLDRHHDFSNKAGVVHSEVLLPDGAPEHLADREKLWNAVEAVELRKDAQLAREIEFAIVARLQHAAPGIKLRLTPYGNDLVETGVVSGTTALVLGGVIDPPDNLVVQHVMDEGLACVVRADHPEVGDRISREQFEGMKHVNIVPPGRMRAGLFQALAQQQLKRDVAISVTNVFAVAEMVAVTDYCASLPALICRRLTHDPRLKVLAAPVDLGTFPVEMAWHVRYRHDPAHRWLRNLISEVAAAI